MQMITKVLYVVNLGLVDFSLLRILFWLLWLLCWECM